VDCKYTRSNTKPLP